ncbi:hypothetical protein [Sphingomicrobium flavum]|uniref:hypothetical protein n=1 Tax=Sphingomicrobium flavum TaxID=1229164 RepID=UPI0021ADB13B|nr:hypothetical protein [Sphingomicrobium flavum]
MASDDWYRQTVWTGEGAAIFEEKLAKSRTQKAQYLTIQANLIWPHHPEVALELADRAQAESEAGFIDPRIEMARAFANLQLGNVEAVLDHYRAAMERQAQQGGIFTSAALDLCFVAAMFEVEDAYDEALAILEKFSGSPLVNTNAQALGAKALILAAIGGADDQAREYARKALDQFVDFGQPLTHEMKIGGASALDFHQRLEAIARA